MFGLQTKNRGGGCLRKRSKEEIDDGGLVVHVLKLTKMQNHKLGLHCKNKSYSPGHF